MLLASPFGPFMVKLFAASRFTRSPSLVTSPAARVATSQAPHASEVERT
jgi:hypothetical protein